MQHLEQQLVALRQRLTESQLLRLGLAALQRRAVSSGIGELELEDALDAAEPKKMLIAFLMGSAPDLDTQKQVQGDAVQNHTPPKHNPPRSRSPEAEAEVAFFTVDRTPRSTNVASSQVDNTFSAEGVPPKNRSPPYLRSSSPGPPAFLIYL